MLLYLVWIALGIPATLLVLFAAGRTKVDLHGGGWVLILITSMAPLQLYPVWHRNGFLAILYGLLCYIAAMGVTWRLGERSMPDSLQWPLISVIVLTAIAAFAALPAVTWPLIRSSVYGHDAGADGLDDSLKGIDLALDEMHQNQENLQLARTALLNGLKEMKRYRASLLKDIREAQERKERAEHDARHPTPKWVEHVISFMIGVISSITAAVAWRFFERTV